GVEGLLTAKGGSTSHAAVIIPQLKKVGVVGLRSLKVDEKSGTGTIHDAVIRRGDFLSLDGWSGAVYRGRHRIEPEPAVPAKV
ncbi:MAG TPA: PEP-utilizing enzyme, partial [Candidatus Aminicenantes bacterium]|nr:PEP-utilizing enzyme [Candidatus Aminicenantes bacterium]